MSKAIPWEQIPCGCRLVGTFEPKKGDFGIDPGGHHWFWDGQHWHDENGRLAKTFEQWMGYEQTTGLGYVKIKKEKR